MTEEDVVEIEQQLGDLPPSYRRWLLSLPPSREEAAWSGQLSRIGEVYFSPAEFLQANQALLMSDWLEGTEWEDEELTDYLVIAGDGCGNYFICDPDDEDSTVQLLAHDPAGIEDAFESLDAFIAEAKRVVSHK